jgi:MFS superfamily sulfate permease-like transporter
MIELYIYFGIFVLVVAVIVGAIVLARLLYAVTVGVRVLVVRFLWNQEAPQSNHPPAQEQQQAAPDPSAPNDFTVEGKKQTRRLKILTTLVQKVS